MCRVPKGVRTEISENRLYFDVIAAAFKRLGPGRSAVSDFVYRLAAPPVHCASFLYRLWLTQFGKI
jgi:hypothetical protein